LAARERQIQLQIAHIQARPDPRRHAAAHQRIDPRQELDKGIGLGEIVIAAGLQALDPVIHLRKGGQKQHRDGIAVLAHFGDDSQPVQSRKHAVDHRHVIRA
jgi:hypothetical protein